LKLMRCLLTIFLICVVRLAAAAELASVPLVRAQLLTLLARDLVGHFNLEGDLQLELVRTWAPPASVARRWTVEVTEYPSLPAAAMLLRGRIVADGSPLAETAFVLRAALLRDVWFTRAPLHAGGAFDASQLEARRVDVFRERDAVPAAVGDRTYLFARSVPPGRALTWHDIARRPLVRKGDLVEVSATEGRLLITLKALALENGAQGDTVTVRNPESQKSFAAVVVDENRVQVRF
jgi:flagellar basal body P-ring formation protein FlgA